VKRLRDELSADDPRLRAAANVLSRIAPLANDPQRQRRVRLMLGSARRRPALLAFLPRPAVALAILLASAAGGGAMAGGGWQYARDHVAWIVHLDSPRVPAPRPSPVRHARAKTDTSGQQKVAALPTVAAAPIADEMAEPVAPTVPTIEPAAIEPVPPLVSTHPLREHRRGAHRRLASNHSRPATAIADAMVPTGPGASLVLEAMQARRAGDSARTLRLLTAYRTKYPDGALGEEALALSLEAAVLRGSEQADDLAQQYLARFPNGRYRQHVEQLRRTPAR
jgi:hypothetical protein